MYHSRLPPSAGGIFFWRVMENSSMNKRLAKTLISFSLPLILSGLLQQLYNWADAFIVGNIEGEVALAAIGATSVGRTQGDGSPVLI